jgi:hypothetical protein
MKKIFLLTIAVISMLGASAQKDSLKGNPNPKQDTMKIKWKSSRIWIFDDPEVKVTVDTAKREPSKPKKKDFAHWGGVDLGLSMLTTIDNKLKLSDEIDTTQMNYFLDLDRGKSWFFSLNLFEKNIRLYKNNLNIVTGLGVEWNNYSFKKNITLNPEAAYISASNTIVNDSLKYSKNKLVVTYVKAPLLLEFNTNSKNPKKSFHISGGMEFAYKLGSKTKQEYEIDGYKVRSKQRDDYHLADFKYSSVLRVGYGGVTVFANYGLSQLFEKNNGPTLFPFTAGISFDL